MYRQKQLTSRTLYAGVCAMCTNLFVVALLAFSSALPASDAGVAGKFHVSDAHTWHDENGWFLDAQFDILLSAGAQDALENAIPLVFELQVQLVRTHKWLWDSVVHERILVRQLEYHALSRSYLVRDNATGKQGVYNKLEDALFAAGSIDSLLLTDAALQSGRNYIVRLRGSNDVEALPTPVRLLAYVSSQWDMESDWYTWQLTR